MSGQTRTIDLHTYYPALDGIRCIAVSMVLFSHWAIYRQLYAFNIMVGFAGVNIFFTLSGFLIARILLAQKEQPGRNVLADFRSFYTRRILRIFPLYYGVIILGLVFAIPNAREEILRLATFTQNVPEADFGFPASGLYRIFWSLSAEEQFYIVFPLLLALVPLKRVRIFFIAMLLLGIASRVTIYLTDYSLYHKKFGANNITLCCFDSLAMGTLLAWYYSYRRDLLRKIVRNMLVFSLTFFVGINVCLVIDTFNPLANILFRLGCSFFCFWLIGSCVLGKLPNWLRSFLTHRFIVYIGKISYGVYVYHIFVPWLFSLAGIINHDFPLSIPVYAIAYTVITIAIAAASWHFFERPINRLKYKLPY